MHTQKRKGNTISVSHKRACVCVKANRVVKSKLFCFSLLDNRRLRNDVINGFAGFVTLNRMERERTQVVLRHCVILSALLFHVVLALYLAMQSLL